MFGQTYTRLARAVGYGPVVRCMEPLLVAGLERPSMQELLRILGKLPECACGRS